MGRWAGVWKMTRIWLSHGGRAWSSDLHEYVCCLIMLNVAVKWQHWWLIWRKYHMIFKWCVKKSRYFLLHFSYFIAWLEALGTSKQHAFIMPSCVTHDRWWCRLKIKMHAMKAVMQQKLPSVIYVFVQFGNWFFIGLEIWITQRSLGYIVICFICLMGKLKPAMKHRSYFTPKII